MIATSKSARASSTARPAQEETAWLLAVAAAFLVVHIVALTISERASASRTVAGQSAISELCD
ncbi:hypothetical protein XH86_23580 [Bradyrhizobium guangdongense]|uniref:Energy transducer TonB n=1 Tax=Bradyrhizobium guangdongense TaxID=1325090 RepID=A0ABX6UJ58_9BRAD|nr:hypothetical protein X265_23560 [Bradyrhizobium guangdongense]QOZ61377.1 hypothetical protein XH86_23580 [Bradyrhizobium guangdongense]